MSLPSKKQIKRACKAIQKNWTRGERMRRDQLGRFKEPAPVFVTDYSSKEAIEIGLILSQEPDHPSWTGRPIHFGGMFSG